MNSPNVKIKTVSFLQKNPVEIDFFKWYYNIDLGVSSLDHRRREEFPAIFLIGVNI